MPPSHPDATPRKPIVPAARGIAALLLCVLVLITWAQFDNELHYDEAIYLNIAKAINRTGIPYRSCFHEANPDSVFVTSPPLVTYVASWTQRFWPSRELPSRLGHLLVFALPTYLLIWYVSRREYGDVAACFSLVALAGCRVFLEEMAMIHLDGPLAFFGLLALWAMHEATRQQASPWWSLLAGGALFAAVWTKYQAICLPVAVGFYLGYLACLRDRATLKRTIRPVAAMGVAGVLAVATLYAYFRFHAGLEWAELLGGITRNVNRVGAPPESFGAVLAATLAEGIHYLGDHLLVVACLAMVPGKVPSRLAALLLCFCLATILFNLWAYRMPGGGSYYLNEMAPALAVLVGRPVAVALSWPQGLKRTVLLAAVVVLLGIQWEKKRPWNLAWPLGHGNRVKAVAGYLKAHTREGDWLLAQDVAPEFYTDRRTGVLRYADPDAVRASLTGKSPPRVAYVILQNFGKAPPHPELADCWKEYRRLLEEHYEKIPVGDEELVILKRKQARPPGER